MTSPSERGRWDAILEQSAVSFLAGHLVDPPAGREAGEVAGALVGRYRLIEEIGRGGMGAVWLAERADGQFEQRVALKLVKRGMDTDEILARFLRERQILARLTHPHIARLLDGGVSGDGRPYFVMEFVAGQPISTYCDVKRLSVDDRLRLFATTCRAVQYAHQSLVIHRDLKPSNVLVTDEGEVKLLDFGVARLLEDEGGGTTTASSVRGPMTPAYASPEQLAGEPVTTASDVYQLGLLLYELLCGQRPWDQRRRAGRESAMIPELDPPRPSSVARQDQQQVEGDQASEPPGESGVSGRRRSTPERLWKRLRGDLDNLTLTALRREPALRYPSAQSLAEDVERHLAQLPLRVRDAGVTYRVAKFIRRHRWRVASAALLLTGLVGGLAFYAMRIRQERDAARREVAKAAQNADLMGQVFATWNPDAANRGEVSASVVLRNARRRAETELEGQPEMLAALLSALGELYTSLNESGPADSMLTRALAIQESLPRTPSADLAATLARRGRLFTYLGNPAEATRSLRRALRMYQELFGANRIETLRVKRDLAVNLRTVERLGEAEALLLGVRDALRETGASSPFGLEVASQLGYVYFLEARYDEAVTLLRATLAQQRTTFGEQYAPALETARFLASALRDRGDLDEAELLYRDALRISRHLYGADDEQAAYHAIVLSILLERKGELEEAEQLTRQTIAILGPGRPATAQQLVRLGGIRLDHGDLAEAERLLRLGVDSLRRAFPEPSPDEADGLNRLAFLLTSRGAAGAGAAYAEAVAFDRQRPAESPVFVSDGLHFLAWAHHRHRDLAAAEATYRRALALYRVQLPARHAYTLFTLRGLGQMLVEQGRAKEGEELLREWREAAGSQVPRG
jgi:tetratricopeptide (TPR) repeat protein